MKIIQSIKDSLKSLQGRVSSKRIISVLQVRCLQRLIRHNSSFVIQQMQIRWELACVWIPKLCSSNCMSGLSACEIKSLCVCVCGRVRNSGALMLTDKGSGLDGSSVALTFFSCCVSHRGHWSFKRMTEQQLSSCFWNIIFHGEDWIGVGWSSWRLQRREGFEEIR